MGVQGVLVDIKSCFMHTKYKHIYSNDSSVTRQIDLLSKDGIIIPENARKLKTCHSATKKTCFLGVLAIDKCHLQIHAF